MQTTYESSPTIELINTSVKTLPRWTITPYCRTVMTVWMISADLLALLLSGYLAIHLRVWLGGSLQAKNYYNLALLLVFFIIGYSLVRLYPGVGVNPIEELKRLSRTSSMIMFCLTALVFLTQSGLRFSRLIFLFFWLFILAVVPLIRWIARKVGLILGIWGEPVALIGFGPQGKHIYQYLRKNPTYGIHPVVLVNGVEKADLDEQPELLEIPEINATELVKDHGLLARAGIRTAIIASFEIPQELRCSLVDEQKFGLERLILISSLSWIGGSAVVPHDLDGILGLEVERNLLHLREQLLKRFLDISIMVFGCLFGFPLILLCALMIRLDSPGPIFYRQRRVGKSGRAIKVLKFRTMVCDADTALENYLLTNPELRAEWEATHKLKKDPRVTRVGKLLRKASLDELPQLINVLNGEMSMVGPRPIVQDEIKHYKEGYRLYTPVLPGVTGLWQVSGRSDTSYERRVAMDEYYIRHWSIWMDIYILLRTFLVVIKGNGAY